MVLKALLFLIGVYVLLLVISRMIWLKKVRFWRDNADLSTSEGVALKNECNEILNNDYYRVHKRK